MGLQLPSWQQPPSLSQASWAAHGPRWAVGSSLTGFPGQSWGAGCVCWALVSGSGGGSELAAVPGGYTSLHTFLVPWPPTNLKSQEGVWLFLYRVGRAT